MVLFFIILGFYLLGLIGRLMLRWWLYRKQKEFSEGGYSFFGGFNNANTGAGEKHKEGEVRVQRVSKPRNKKVSKDVGDYVEFEEVVEITEETVEDK